MLLKDKVALVFGAGGAIGGAVAEAFALEGARLYLSGRNPAPVEAVAKNIRSAGGAAETAQVDSLDEEAVERHVAEAIKKAGRIDIIFNAMGFEAVQGMPLTELALDDFSHPISTWTSAQFLTARAAARHMASRRSGVILLLSASPARLGVPMTGGFGVACAAIEALSRTLAAELGPQGVRVLCLRPHRIGDAMGATADFPQVQQDEFRTFLEGMTLLKRLPMLADVAKTAAFLASDQAAAMTGAVANLTAGMDMD